MFNLSEWKGVGCSFIGSLQPWTAAAKPPGMGFRCPGKRTARTLVQKLNIWGNQIVFFTCKSLTGYYWFCFAVANVSGSISKAPRKKQIAPCKVKANDRFVQD